jgi:CRISPR-associated protein Cmr4
MNNIKRHLLTLYTRTPLHVGSGTSVDVVDLPIMRERITGFPVIPASSLKGVLLQRGREVWEAPHATGCDLPEQAKILFGGIDETKSASGEKERKSNAGCVQIMEAKILAFPVRSLAGCFAWLTCPAALQRFQRDTGCKFTIPAVDKDRVVAGSELVIPGQNQVVLEEYALDLQGNGNDGRKLDPDGAEQSLCTELGKLTGDSLWAGKLNARLAIVHDENFQHFVTTCTEVVARIVINPATRTNDNLFNQENVPCEALFYSVLTVLPARRRGVDATFDANAKLAELLPVQAPPILQIGGDETTGHGLCETKLIPLEQTEAQ